jgi:choline kinase
LVGIILAAGAGSRLYPLTSQIPKTLLEIGPSLTMLGLAVENLSRAGCSEVAVVVGENSSVVENWLGEREASVVDVSLVPTGRDSSWNNAFSLWAARDWLRRGAMILNGDTVVPGSVVEEMASDASAECLLAIDRGADLAPEQMKVSIGAQGEVMAIGKHLEREDSDGEFIGLSYVPATAADGVIRCLEEAYVASRARWYEDGYGRFVASGATMRAWAIGEVDWVEVDTVEDLERARSLGWLQP